MSNVQAEFIGGPWDGQRTQTIELHGSGPIDLGDNHGQYRRSKSGDYWIWFDQQVASHEFAWWQVQKF